MIIGLPRWDDPGAYYSQANNVVESILGKAGVTDRLETCGPTAAVMLLDAAGKLPEIVTPGGWRPQPEDVLAAWMNDPRNVQAMRLHRADLDPARVMGNRVPQWYAPAISAVFGEKIRAVYRVGFDPFSVRVALEAGRGVMACLINPGHYIAIVAMDTDTGELVYHDPWPGNPWPARYKGQPGRARRMSQDDMANVKPFRVEIG